MRRKDDASPEQDRIRMHHMLAAARETVGFVAGRSRADLDTDRMLARAVLNAVQEIGEAASRTGDAGRRLAPDIPWDAIVRSRHIIVHGYFHVDHDAIWRITQEHLPTLIVQLEAALSGWTPDPH